MMNRLELALMLSLLFGSLMSAVLVANPRASAATGTADPVAVAPQSADAADAPTTEADAEPLRLPSFDAFDHAGFGLLPGLAPRWSTSAR